MRSAKSEHDYPFAIDNTAAALLDRTGTVVAWTAAAEVLLGRNAGEVCDRPVWELLADGGTWEQVLGQRTGPAWEGRAELRHGSGRVLKVGFRVLPFLGRVGERCYLVLGAPLALVARWRQDHAFTQELFDQSRIGLAVFDTRLRLVRTNTHLLPYTGLPADSRGMRLSDFLWAEDAGALETRLQEVLHTGHPLVNHTALARTLEDSRGGRVLTVSAFRLHEPGGRLMGVAAAFIDATEHHRARDRLDLLHEATVALGGSLSVHRIGQGLAEALVPGLADAAAVDLAEEVFVGSEPVPQRYRALSLRRAAVAGPEEAGLRAGARMVAVTDGSVPGEPGTERGVRFPVRPGGAGPGGQAPPGWMLQVPGTRAGMSALLSARGALLGRLTLWRITEQAPFDVDDLTLLEEIAARAAMAVDNARRYAREHRAAVSLQRSLLPPATTDSTAVETASVYLPADAAGGVSGDWFDVIPLSSARVALVVGDVVGHGLQATATMGRLRTAVRTLSDLDLEPEELLTHLNDLVVQLAGEADSARSDGGQTGAEPDTVGATCLYAVYDPVTQQCVMSSAGHPPPAVVAPDGDVRFAALSPGPPLGVGGLPFEPAETRVAPGSVLALYTDGLVERGIGDIDEGMRELRSRLSRADVLRSPLGEVGNGLVMGLPPGRLPDDVTLLLARTRAVPAADTVVWTLDADPSVVATARERVAGQLADWGLEELAFTTELVASELVTNAIRHAGGPVELRLIRTDTLLTGEVSDPSNTHPKMRRAAVTDEGGRGLYLVAQLTKRWGNRYTRRGKTIWTEQPLRPAR
jgi:PAS domain-containing protein/anti-sigma regulatory factor (Ser/Thr protein kinase)